MDSDFLKIRLDTSVLKLYSNNKPVAARESWPQVHSRLLSI
jgi:hypothetical protein